ncbi:nucleoside hydrolase [Plantibacter sp. CFBP 8804]|uniref:nucleoside hydrolase n=1 Tax=Plantibacter sp. CFBP 8804 TaxID=2775270 RepID=UPI0018FED834|nr:nucleoside hydrolase [Plantibacter sp. CFBP 8804]
MRVIIDNDFSGDPDDHFQLVHHLLSPSVTVPFVIGSHLSVDDFLDGSSTQASNAVRIAAHIVDLLGMSDQVPLVRGSEVGLTSLEEPIHSSAARAIVSEAMREDTDLPLYIAAGAGLTEIASALLIEPRIAERTTLVWIGGAEHSGTTMLPPGGGGIEYNLNIDPIAAQVVFNHFPIPIWQIPRDVYRQCIVSQAELDARVRPMGPVGAFLANSIDELVKGQYLREGLNLGETYVLGDSPLVLLTALQSAFQPDSSSSVYTEIPTPSLSQTGEYGDASGEARLMRLYHSVDVRLMFDDFYLKLAAFARGTSQGRLVEV